MTILFNALQALVSSIPANILPRIPVILYNAVTVHNVMRDTAVRWGQPGILPSTVAFPLLASRLMLVPITRFAWTMTALLVTRLPAKSTRVNLMMVLPTLARLSHAAPALCVTGETAFQCLVRPRTLVQLASIVLMTTAFNVLRAPASNLHVKIQHQLTPATAMIAPMASFASRTLTSMVHCSPIAFARTTTNGIQVIINASPRIAMLQIHARGTKTAFRTTVIATTPVPARNTTVSNGNELG